MESGLVPALRVAGVLCEKRAGACTAARMSDLGARFDLNRAMPILPRPSLEDDGPPLLALLVGA